MLNDISFVICLDSTKLAVEYTMLCFWNEKKINDYFITFTIIKELNENIFSTYCISVF